MAVSCQPRDLAIQAVQFSALPTRSLLAVQVSLLCALANVNCDPNTLANDAACLSCLTPDRLLAVIAFLLCRLVNTGASSTCITCSETAPTLPPDVGVCDCSIVFGIGAIAGNLYVWDTTTNSWFPTIGGP